jgi:hypothetical protein
VEAEPYGAEVTITEAECMNHVSNRMGSALRKFVADKKKKLSSTIFEKRMRFLIDLNTGN